MNEEDAMNELGVEQHERATARKAALSIIADGGDSTVALVHAVLSAAARIEELTVYVAQLR